MSQSVEYDERLKRIEGKVTYACIMVNNIFTTGIGIIAYNKAEELGGIWGSAAQWVVVIGWLIGGAWLNAEIMDDRKK